MAGLWACMAGLLDLPRGGGEAGGDGRLEVPLSSGGDGGSTNTTYKPQEKYKQKRTKCYFS